MGAHRQDITAAAPHRGLRSALAAVALVCAGSRAASADPSCAELAEAPRAATSASSAWAAEIWRSVRATDERLSGLGPGPAIVWVRSARSGAWYCASDDTVYVADALVDYAWRGRSVDGGSLIGFVLAHELAHRHFDRRGARAGATGPGACSDEQLAVEARADRRAAFVIALARDPDDEERRLSPFALAQRDSIGAWIEAELGWAAGCPARERRARALLDGVSEMTRLARLYEVALALVFVGAHGPDDDAVTTLLALVDAAASPPDDAGRWAAIPELKLARALAHLDRAARAGWCPESLRAAPLAPSPCELRCIPVAPAHALLSPVDRLGERGRAPIDRNAELAAVRRLSAEARDLGALPEQVLGVELCEAFESRAITRTSEALDRLDAALAAFGQTARRALAELRAASDLQSFLVAEPAPVGSAPWRDALAELRADRRWPASSQAEALAASWLGEASAASPAPSPLPVDLAPRLDAWVRAATCGALATTRLAGGWRVSTGAACAEIDGPSGAARRLVEFTPTGLSASVSDWERHCTLEPRGHDDAGAVVVLARCPAWDGPGAGWLLSTREGRCLRGVRFSTP
ncbi:MAG: hypothetical protein IT385_10595 [Deltaproteobacteria bacterium]|nr:hypothetical protein [Deltaproteobacteria bacterium]